MKLFAIRILIIAIFVFEFNLSTKAQSNKDEVFGFISGTEKSTHNKINENCDCYLLKSDRWQPLSSKFKLLKFSLPL
jgi:hypothetical protein